MLPLLQDLMPFGHAWSSLVREGTTLYELVKAASIEFCRVQRRIEAVEKDAIPSTTRESLIKWERFAGVPDDCSTAIDESNLGERRTRLVDGLQPGEAVTHQTYRDFDQFNRVWPVDYAGRVDAFTCESECTDAIYAPEWGYRVEVFVGGGYTQEDIECAVKNPPYTYVDFSMMSVPSGILGGNLWLTGAELKAAVPSLSTDAWKWVSPQEDGESFTVPSSVLDNPVAYQTRQAPILYGLRPAGNAGANPSEMHSDSTMDTFFGANGEYTVIVVFNAFDSGVVTANGKLGRQLLGGGRSVAAHTLAVINQSSQAKLAWVHEGISGPVQVEADITPGTEHIAHIRWDGSNIYIQIDDQAEVAGPAVADAADLSSFNLVLGQDDASGYFDGYILDVTVHDFDIGPGHFAYTPLRNFYSQFYGATV